MKPVAEASHCSLKITVCFELCLGLDTVFLDSSYPCIVGAIYPEHTGNLSSRPVCDSLRKGLAQ